MSNSQQNSFLTPKKSQIIKNILIQLSDEYKQTHKDLKLPTFKKTAETKRHDVIDISSDEEEESQRPVSGKENCKDNHNRNRAEVSKCVQSEPVNVEEQANIFQQEEVLNSSEEYPVYSVDPNEVLSHSVGTFIDLDKKPSMASSPVEEDFSEFSTFSEDSLHCKSAFF